MPQLVLPGVLILAMAACSELCGQFPGQYPPGQYPPGQYPNDSRLPGGIPMPRFPKRKPKEASGKAGQEAKVNAASVDGSLRKVREKDLLLQSKRGLLRFRLLAKTQFQNKAGEPVRDSLLHPGDLVSIQVNPDDEETALRVILVREGSAAERAAADKPFDESAARAPRAEDLSKPRTITVKDTPSEEPAVAESAPAAAPEDAKTVATTDEQLIQAAGIAAKRFGTSLPPYAARQTTSRYFSTTSPPAWQAMDVITAELSYHKGKAEYSDIKIDDTPTNKTVEKTGSWQVSEFTTTVEDLFAADTNASFKRRGEERVRSRSAIVFDFAVPQSNSHWTLVAPDQRRYSPAYEGAIWIDSGTHQVLRIEQRSKGIPQDFPLSKVESTLEYMYVNIGQRPYLVPASGESVGCVSGGGACTRTVASYKDYRPVPGIAF